MIKDIVRELLRFAPRQAENGQRTAEFIKTYLEKNGIEVTYDRFKTSVPLVQKESLTVDGRKIECRGVSFVSGTVTDKDSIAASTIPSRYLLLRQNINFNPYSVTRAICRNNFYFAPALAVRNSDLMKVVNARTVRGEVKVKKWTGEVRNVLAGNRKNPKNIVFAHYDSLGTGATDNASGVATCMDTIVRHPDVLTDTLFVFDGNEELSYDQPTYWGRGFRVFEKKYPRLMARAQKLIPIDSIGNGATQVNQDPYIVNLAFPIKNMKRWAKKTFVIHGDIHALMSVYHSDNDTLEVVNERQLKGAQTKLLALLSRSKKRG